MKRARMLTVIALAAAVLYVLASALIPTATQQHWRRASTTQYRMYLESMGQPLQDNCGTSSAPVPCGIWNTPLADNAPIDPESSKLVAILDQYFPGPNGPTGSKANFSENSGLYYYIASANTPYLKVTLDPGAPYQQQLQHVFNQVPLPQESKPSPDTDRRMTILQPSSGCEWELWRLSQASDGTWHAGWGGRMCHIFGQDGVYRNVQDTAGNVLEQNNWGAPASGFPAIAGAMMVDELAHGLIPHAVAFALDARANCQRLWSKPAQRTDGFVMPVLDANGEPTNCVPEGARFRLPPPCPAGTASTPGVCFNVSDLAGGPPITIELAHAAQTYGLIDENSTNGGLVGVESGDPQGDPYLVLGADPYTTAIPGEPNTPFNGTYGNQAALALFPWSWLQLTQMSPTSTREKTIYSEADPPSPLWPTP